MTRLLRDSIVVIFWGGFGDRVLVWYVEVMVLLDAMITTKQGGGLEKAFFERQRLWVGL